MARKKTVEPAVEVTEVTEKAIETGTEDIKAAESKAAEKAEEKPKKAPAKRRCAKPECAETKKNVKAEPEKKAAAKPAAEKATKTTKESTKKTSAKSGAQETKQKSSLHIQYAGKSLSEEELIKRAKDSWQYDLGNEAGDLNSIELYVKPEENKVYYVINEDVTGSFDI